MTQPINPLLIKRLERFYRDWCEGRADAASAHEFTFHMTDWTGDLQALYELFENPEAVSAEQFEQVLYGFLIHASGHILAAAEMVDVEPVRFNQSSKKKPSKRRSAIKPS